MIDFYVLQLVLLALLSLALNLVNRHLLHRTALSTDNSYSIPKAAKLTREYLLVYAIVGGADWLQGPYMYSLYSVQYGLQERVVALLFVVGYSSGGIASPLVGNWADQYSRKRMSMISCVTFALSSLFINIPLFPILLLGRLLGGVSGAIHSSCFQSWLVSSANAQALSSRQLSAIFGHAALVNSIVAAGAGVASDKLMERTGSFASPFIASGILLIPGIVVIARTWSENYGKGSRSNASVRHLQHLFTHTSSSRLFVLRLIQTCFEGSLHLFIFVWVPLLQEAASAPEDLPLGYIFSSFMLYMHLGALLYSSIISLSPLDTHHEIEGDIPSPSSQILTLSIHAKISAGILAASALTFLAAVGREDEHMRFWTFCAFEICAFGIYYPVQGMLRGRLVSNEHRATVS
ncbi:hypothetical protein C8Q74DRAFT_1208199 [Fomes fomentarius]|nr:hypothetical protein C8Q74DRAFT_1208199 [Fomes fomentarius]